MKEWVNKHMNKWISNWRWIHCNSSPSPNPQFLYSVHWLNAYLTHFPALKFARYLYICAVLSPVAGKLLKIKEIWPEPLCLSQPQHSNLHRARLSSSIWESPLWKPRVAYHYCHRSKCNIEIQKSCTYLLKHVIYFSEGPNKSNSPTLRLLILINSFYP